MDWKTKIKNKVFWLALVPAVLLVVQYIAVPFGYNFDFAGLNTDLVNIINAVFAVLAILGIAVNPNTPGVTDKEEK
jgi:phi LC3 family holin